MIMIITTTITTIIQFSFDQLYLVCFHFLYNLPIFLIGNLTTVHRQYHEHQQNYCYHHTVHYLHRLIMIAVTFHLLSSQMFQNLNNRQTVYNISSYFKRILKSKWRLPTYFIVIQYKCPLCYQLLSFIMDTKISEWVFDFSKPIYLVHPNFKFWEVKQSGKQLVMRVGKLRGASEDNVQVVTVSYASNSAARNKATDKIQQKLTKGYTPRDAKKSTQIAAQKKQSLKDQIKQDKSKKNTRVFSGEYYEKGSQAVKLEVNDRKVRITRITGGKQKYEIRSYDSYNQAVDFCLQQQNWLVSEGFKANNSKFIYSFIDEDNNEDKKSKDTTKTRKKQEEKSDSKFLSITKMTDEAISHRSRNNSVAKSDRSYGGDEEDNGYVPSKLGNPTSGPISVLLAETWDNDVDPTGWIMSEKLDGVRCFWTGTTMYSRNGNRFFFPKFFTRGWPKSQMDGELFIDRGKFSETLSAVRKNNPIDSEWQKVKYLVFDVPGLKLPFKQRLKAMQNVIKQVDSPYLKCHAHRKCESYEDLFKQLEQVNKIEGQGLMLRDPESKYQNRRSKSLLKVKTFHDDEAQVIGYKPGTGRCHGMVGALRVRNTHGVEFQVGSGMTDQIRRKPPKIGSKITYKYQQFNKDSGKPRFPTYLRTFDKI